jgi:putative ABC transport system permease protein
MKQFLAENAPGLTSEYKVVSMADQAASTVRRPLLILLGAVAFVLLIAVANVTSLLVAHAHARERKLAVRSALGAARGRIARQLVTENLVLCALGTALGLVIADWGTSVMLALVPGSLPRADDIGLDWRVLSLAGGLAVLTAAGFGVAAAYAVGLRRNRSGAAIATALHTGDTRSAGSVRRRSARRLLVAAEVALSVMLLIGAALLTRSFVRLQQIQPGFEPANVLTAHVGLPVAGRPQPAVDGARWATVLYQITDQLASSPGVTAVGATSSLPVSGVIEGGGVLPVGRVYEPGQTPWALYNVVAGDYFRAAGIRLVTGRAFDASDRIGSRATIIVSRRFAREQFKTEADAVGREVSATFEMIRGRPPRTIVGVVDDVKQISLEGEPTPQVYLPLAQMPYPFVTLVVRTSGSDPAAFVPLVRRTVREVSPAATISDVRPMENVVSESLARQRFQMTLIGTFAILALVLAGVGLYGVLALIVHQRRREIGVRLALGASPRVVVRMLLGEGARVAGVGVVIGLAGAFAVTRVLQSLLYGVSTTDTMTFLGAALFVATVALAATWVPARRAAHLDPRSALAAE